MCSDWNSLWSKGIVILLVLPVMLGQDFDSDEDIQVFTYFLLSHRSCKLLLRAK